MTTGIDFAQFGMESDIVFEATTGLYEGIIILFQTNKKVRQICEFIMDFEKSFFLLF